MLKISQIIKILYFFRKIYPFKTNLNIKKIFILKNKQKIKNK